MRRVLRRNHTTRVPARHVVFDCETFPEALPSESRCDLHTLRLGCATYFRLAKGEIRSEVKFDFRGADEFWDWFATRLSRSEPVWLWAHNLAFDLTAARFWERLESGEYSFRGQWEVRDRKRPGRQKVVHWRGFAATEGPPTIIKVRHRSGATVTMCDTLNWWRMSLAELAPHFGWSKLPMPSWDEPEEAWRTYCRRDVDCTAAAVLSLLRWVGTNDYGVFKATAPAQALAAFSHRFMAVAPVATPLDWRRDLERAAYYGGQTELYFHGSAVPWPEWVQAQREHRRAGRPPVAEGPVYHLDVTSLYPSVMRQNRYPVNLEKVLEHPSLAELRAHLEVFYCLARVEVSCLNRTYPRRDAEGTYYDHGRYWTVLSGPELVRCVEGRDLRQVEVVLCYSAADLFTPFVDHFWERRLVSLDAGDHAGGELCKLMLNGLAGKLGQLTPEWVDRPQLVGLSDWGVWPRLNTETGAIQEFRSLAGHVQEHLADREKERSWPAVAGAVTAYARERMRALRRLAGERQVFCQVVDALYVTQLGYDALVKAGEVADRQLGKLRLRGRYDRVDFLGTNTLRCDGELRAAGLKRGARAVGPDQYEQLEFESLNGMLARRPLPGVRVWKRSFTPTTDYPRGIIGQEGWITPRWQGNAERYL